MTGSPSSSTPDCCHLRALIWRCGYGPDGLLCGFDTPNYDQIPEQPIDAAPSLAMTANHPDETAQGSMRDVRGGAGGTLGDDAGGLELSCC